MNIYLEKRLESCPIMSQCMHVYMRCACRKHVTVCGPILRSSARSSLSNCTSGTLTTHVQDRAMASKANLECKMMTGIILNVPGRCPKLGGIVVESNVVSTVQNRTFLQLNQESNTIRNAFDVGPIASMCRNGSA